MVSWLSVKVPKPLNTEKVVLGQEHVHMQKNKLDATLIYHVQKLTQNKLTPPGDGQGLGRGEKMGDVYNSVNNKMS